MIRVALADEPASFAGIRTRGLNAIAEMIGDRPLRANGKRFKKVAEKREDIPPDKFPDYWTEALDDLMRGYRYICAYSCFRIHEVTGARSVDHMASKSKRWDKVYEWSNYRLACALLNSRKKDYEDVLDPFEIQDDWFQLELVGFQVVPNRNLSPDGATYQKIQNTIVRLGLNDFRDERERCAADYWKKDISLKKLTEDAPFIARELRRLGRLNSADA